MFSRGTTHTFLHSGYYVGHAKIRVKVRFRWDNPKRLLIDIVLIQWICHKPLYPSRVQRKSYQARVYSLPINEKQSHRELFFWASVPQPLFLTIGNWCGSRNDGAMEWPTCLQIRLETRSVRSISCLVKLKAGGINGQNTQCLSASRTTSGMKESYYLERNPDSKAEKNKVWKNSQSIVL